MGRMDRIVFTGGKRKKRGDIPRRLRRGERSKDRKDGKATEPRRALREYGDRKIAAQISQR